MPTEETLVVKLEDKMSGPAKQAGDATASSFKKTKLAIEDMSKNAQTALAKLSAAEQTAMAQAMAAEEQAKKIDAQRKLRNAQGRQTVKAIKARSESKLALGEQQKENAQVRAEEQRLTDHRRSTYQTRYALLRNSLSQENKLKTEARAKERQEASRDASAIDRIMARARRAPEATQRAIQGAITGTGPSMIRQMYMSGGASRSASFERLLRPVVGTEGAAFLTGTPGFNRPAALGGKDTEALKAARDLAKIRKDQLNTENQLFKADRFQTKEMELQVKLADQERAELEKAANAAINRSKGGGLAVRDEVKNLLTPLAVQQKVAQGNTTEEAITALLGQRFGLSGASYLATGAGKKPPVFGGSQVGGAGGGRGGIAGILRRLGGAGGGGVGGSLLGGLLGGIGVGVGGYALANIGQGLVDASKQATAYERQTVAARNLAGGQKQLNDLLDEYQKESGGAISKTDSLAAVTRLLSTGYAKSVKDLGTFTRATRGASIALGRPQEQVTQDVQLAISNTSVKRLDQIGLGIKEVNDRVTLLRKNDKGLQREQAFGAAVMQLLDEKYGKLSKTAEGQATGLERLAKAWDDLTLAQGKNVKGPINNLAGGVASGLGGMRSVVQSIDEFQVGSFKNWNRFADNTGISSLYQNMFGITRAQMNAGRMLQMPKEAASLFRTDRGDGPNGYVAPYAPVSRWDSLREDQQDVLTNAYKQFTDMEKNYNKQRADEIDNYNQSVASSEKNFHKSMLREDEDFARSRLRSERDYQKQVKRTLEDNADRDAGYEKDYNKNVAKTKEDSNKRLKDIEEQYQEDQQKALKQHRLAMLKAAGQLDAIALLDERTSFKEDNDERKKNHEKQVKEEQENVADRLKDLKESYDDQLNEAHKADKKQADRAAEDRKQQLDDEDEDRGIAKGRAIEDHNDELAEMDRVHNEKMAKITSEYNDQVKAFQDALGDDLAAVGIYLDGYQEKLDARNKKILDFYDTIADKIEKAMKLDTRSQVMDDTVKARNPDLPAYAQGGFVPRTGVALLHAGEYVVPASMAAAVSNNNYGGSSSRVVQIHAGAFQVYTTPGMETMVGQQIEEIMIKHFQAA